VCELPSICPSSANVLQASSNIKLQPLFPNREASSSEAPLRESVNGYGNVAPDQFYCNQPIKEKNNAINYVSKRHQRLREEIDGELARLII